MTRAQSMDVINDSTTLQSRIDAVLAAPIMEWDHSPEIDWQPGDALWAHPNDRVHEVQDWSSPVLEMPHGWLYSRAQSGDAGNCPRWMFEVIGLDDYFVGTDDDGNPIWGTCFNHDDTMDGAMGLVDCDDCLVGIGDEDTNCWFCGKRVRMQSRVAEAEERRARDMALYQAAREQLFSGMDLDSSLIFTSSSMGLRGVTPSRLVFDELPNNVEWVSWDGGTSDDYVSYCRSDIEATLVAYRLRPRISEPLNINDPSLYNTSYTINSPQRFGRTEHLSNVFQFLQVVDQGLEQAQQVQRFEVPSVNLQESHPDLYRPGYERYFENPTERHPSHARHLPRYRSADR